MHKQRRKCRNTTSHLWACAKYVGLVMKRPNLQTGETLLYSGKNEKRHKAGVGLLFSIKAAKRLLEWNLVSDRIITARF